MSENARTNPRPWYRRERWLAVELAALPPTIAAFVVPESARPTFVIISALLLLGGLVMLVMRGPARSGP